MEPLKWNLLNSGNNNTIRNLSIGDLENINNRDRINGVLWKALGEAYFRAGRFQDAARAFRLALEFNSRF